jgi:hypothetical protein
MHRCVCTPKWDSLTLQAHTTPATEPSRFYFVVPSRFLCVLSVVQSLDIMELPLLLPCVFSLTCTRSMIVVMLVPIKSSKKNKGYWICMYIAMNVPSSVSMISLMWVVEIRIVLLKSNSWKKRDCCDVSLKSSERTSDTWNVSMWVPCHYLFGCIALRVKK